MSIVTLRVYQAFDWYASGLFNKKLPKEHTYVVIFGPDQDKDLEFFTSDKFDDERNILFISKKAINRSPNHGTEPRNTLVVFEVK